MFSQIVPLGLVLKSRVIVSAVYVCNLTQSAPASLEPCKIFIASRLHSAILATLARVPSICLYYVDKGRLFFEQAGLSRFARPIEMMTTKGSHRELIDLTEQLLGETEAVKLEQSQALEQMKRQLRDDLAQAFEAVLR